MKKVMYIVASLLLINISITAQANQQNQVISPPKGDGSHVKDTSYSSSGASKDEVRGAYGQGNNDTDTIIPKRKRKFPFNSPSPGNTNATNGSNIAPGR